MVLHFKINICKVKFHLGNKYSLDLKKKKKKKKKRWLFCWGKQNDIKLTLLEKEQVHGLIPAGQDKEIY